MANFIQSSNMLLPIPIVGVDPGPDYALNIDACFALIDSHNHSANQGVPINPNGLNINADLPINGNNLTLIRSLRLSAQGSPLALSTDLGCIYESGVDLYYNDGNGNQIRITASGAVAGASGTITGLPSGTASASYGSLGGTFVWQSSTNTAAIMDFQSAILRNSSASSHGLTLSAPTLSSDYSLILPHLPSSNATFLQLDTSGNMSAINTADGIASLMTTAGTGSIVSTASAANAQTLASKITWSSWTPSFSSAGGIDSSSITTARYLIVGKMCSWYLSCIVDLGTANNVITFSLPTAANLSAVQSIGSGNENGNKIMFVKSTSGDPTKGDFVNYDASNHPSVSATYQMSGFYEIS